MVVDDYPMISKERKRELAEMAKNLKLPLPPEVSCWKEILSTRQTVYMFRHQDFGDLGRMLIFQNKGESQCVFEVIGDEDDPMTAQRKTIFEPIAHDMSDFMEATIGKGTGTIKSYETPAQSQMFEAERITCRKCGTLVAFIVYSSDDTRASLEDNARFGFAKAKEFNVPTWVIGEESDVVVNNQYVSRFLSLKVWPEREPMRLMLGTELDDLLCPLVEDHC
jgi:hypothetical protein